MTPQDPNLLVPPGHVGFLPSVAVVFVLGLLVPGLGLALSLGRALASRAWARRARLASLQDTLELRAGPAVIVGEVLTDEAEVPEPGVAVRVSLVQRIDGRIAREVKRQVDAAPFYIRTADGEHVRIEPGTQLTLLADLATAPSSEPLLGLFRTRVARLRSGERAIAAGILGRGFNPRGSSTYRAAEGGWVLASSPRSGLWISGDSLEGHFLRKARFFAVYAALFAALFAIAQLLFAPFYVLGLLGVSERCAVTRVSSSPVHSRHLRRPPQMVYGHCGDGPALEEPARPELAALIAESSGVRVTRVRHGRQHMLGPVPTVSYVTAGLLTMLSLLALGLVRVLAGRSSRSWYESHPFIEDAEPLLGRR